MLSRFSLCLSLSLTALLLASCKTGYHKEDGKVWLYGWNTLQGSYRDEVTGADYATFLELSDGYARDAYHAWHGLDLLDGADGSAFSTLGKEYARDGKHVFHKGRVVDGADPATFRVRSESYAEDSRDCYWDGTPLCVADRQSFHLVGRASDYRTSWAIDRRYVYYLTACPRGQRRLMPIADYDSFEPIHPVREGDDFISYDYARDSRQVYYCDTIIAGADPATFRELKWHIARDSHHLYAGRHPLPPDAHLPTLKSIDNFFAADSLHVYFHGHPMPDVDPRDFRQWEYTSRIDSLRAVFGE